ncbi:MAG: hypothetical protein KatS3mg051_0315 [Anaerolineae bacterium]|nr:MAG: hypothetical protein KatS3mg051_0315 [Anaerolineae bacterium]
MLLAAHSITPSTGEGPAHGTLVMGRFVETREGVGALASLGTIRIWTIRHFAEPGLPRRLPARLRRAQRHGQRAWHRAAQRGSLRRVTPCSTTCKERPVSTCCGWKCRARSAARGRDTVGYLLAALLRGRAGAGWRQRRDRGSRHGGAGVAPDAAGGESGRDARCDRLRAPVDGRGRTGDAGRRSQRHVALDGDSRTPVAG